MSQKPEPEKPLAHQVRPFCERISICPSTFWKYVKTGKIRVIRIGGRTLVPHSEVERLLNGEAA